MNQNPAKPKWMQRCLLSFGGLLVAVSTAVGSPDAPRVADGLNVGDRVEVDNLGDGNWRTGLVVTEDERFYVVRMDPLDPGGFMANFVVPKKGVYETRIRASTASLPEAQKKNTSEPTGILDCPINEGINRRGIDNAVLARLIRCVNEYKNGSGASSLGTDSRFDITSMMVGKPRVWNVLNDVGPGTASTRVYPVQVSYTQTWWSRDSVRTMKGIAIYGCYYSTLAKWICGLNSSVKNEPMLTQPRR